MGPMRRMVKWLLVLQRFPFDKEALPPFASLVKSLGGSGSLKITLEWGRLGGSVG